MTSGAAWLQYAMAEAWEAARAQRATRAKSAAWREGYPYRNAETGRYYNPHTDTEREWVFSDTPAYPIALGGEGSGKSVAGIIKALERVRRGMSGIMVSPDFEHFKRSLWPEFRRWCPWDFVVESQRHRRAVEWTPNRPFAIVFNTQYGNVSILCGGIDNPGSWEGPNVNWFHGDEFRHKQDAAALKVLVGRIRIMGPNGEPPQGWLTTTPKKNWLFDYYGPKIEDEQGDPLAAFKDKTRVMHMKTLDNADNLSPDYIEQRGAALVESEKRVYLEGEWEDIEDGTPLLESITIWDGCREALPALGEREPMVLAIDAGIKSDSFGIVGVTRHPQRREHVAVRYVREWEPKPGAPVDFDGPREELRRLCKSFNILCVVYDPYQLHDMATGLAREGLAWFVEFNQGGPRLESDAALLQMIIGRTVAHDGDEALRKHIRNADRKLDAESRKLRIVKRSENKKIDLAVCLSMAAYQCRRLNI